MVIILTESQYNYIKRRYLQILPIFERELEDQVPAWYNNKFGKNEGIERYYDTVKDSVVEFIMYDIPNFYDIGDENDDSDYAIGEDGLIRPIIWDETRSK